MFYVLATLLNVVLVALLGHEVISYFEIGHGLHPVLALTAASLGAVCSFGSAVLLTSATRRAG